MQKASKSAVNLTSLSQALALKKEQDRQQVQELTATALKKLESSLKTQSADVLTSTGSAIQTQADALAGKVTGTLSQAQESAQQQGQQLQQALAQQGEVLKQELERQGEQLQKSMEKIGNQKATLSREVARTERLLKWLRWIWMASLIVCLLGFAGIWAYWKLSPPWETITAQDGKEWQVMKGSNWQMCQGNRPCRLSGTQ